MKNLKRALAELEIIDSMEGFCVTEPYFIRGIVAGITVKVHSLTVNGEVSRNVYWIPVTDEGCPADQDQLILFHGVKPGAIPRLKRVDFYLDRENEFISKDEFIDLQVGLKEEAKIRSEGDELQRLRSSVLTREKKLGLFDSMLDMDREECSYDCFYGIRFSRTVKEAIAERYA